MIATEEVWEPGTFILFRSSDPFSAAGQRIDGYATLGLIVAHQPDAQDPEAQVTVFWPDDCHIIHYKSSYLMTYYDGRGFSKVQTR